MISTRSLSFRDPNLTAIWDKVRNGVRLTKEDGLLLYATWKHGYPNPCIMPDDVLKKVVARWGEYGLR